jgi:peptidoglycan/LPS O-acetylase OafA/YrhL
MNRDTSLDIARSLSMIFIIGFWHITDYTSIFKIGPWGVYLMYMVLGCFMYISGYLLAYKYKEINSFDALQQFYTNRFIRIYPLFLLAVISYALLFDINIRNVIFSLLCISNFIPPQLGTLWFVSMILVFYLLYPLLYKNLYYFFGIIVLLIGFNLIFGGLDKRIIYYLSSFQLGILFAKNKWSIRLPKYVNLLILLIASSLAILLSYKIILPSPIYILSFCCIGFFFIYSFSLVINERLFVFRSFFKWISYSSFCAYMFHRQIYALFLKVLPSADSMIRLLVLWIIVFPSTIIIGYYFQLIYDKCIKYCYPQKYHN